MATKKAVKKQDVFDFGLGETPAHRHVNKNGDVGGWVAESAKVAPTCYVGENARVYGDAQVKSTRDYFCFQVFGSRNSTLTITLKPEIRVTTGCFEYKTLKEFEAQILETHGSNDYGKEYLAAIEFIKIVAQIRGA